jgi:hypothetical protein
MAFALLVSLGMVAFGLVIARDDRRPALRHLVDRSVAGEPVAFEGERSWAYQPRYVGGLGNSDWSVCRTFVVTGSPGPSTCRSSWHPPASTSVTAFTRRLTARRVTPR